jgi:hypothetical protein
MRNIHLAALAAAITLLSARSSGAQPLVYNGGPIVSNPQVVLVGLETQIPATFSGFVSELATNPTLYLSLLKEYDTTGVSGGPGHQTSSNQGIVAGALVGTFQGLHALQGTRTLTMPAHVDPSWVSSQIDSQISAGNLPAPTTDGQSLPNTIYLVLFPSGTRLTRRNNSTVEICEDHDVSHAGAIVGMVSGTAECRRGSVLGQPVTSQDAMTVLTTRALANAITDPTGSGQSLRVGWHVPQSIGEVATLCDGSTGDVPPPASQTASTYDLGSTGSVTIGTKQFAVQQLWSNRQNACVPPPQPADDFTVSVSPTELTVNPGTFGVAQLTVPITKGTSVPIGVATTSTLPAGVSVIVSPPVVSSGGSGLYLVSTTAAAPVGSYKLTIDASGTSGGFALEHVTTLTLNVALEHFTMSVSPTSGIIQGGASIALTVSTSLASGNGIPITLSASNLPTGLAASFSPASVMPGQNATLLLTGDASLAFDPDVTFSVNATNGQMTQTQAITLETFSGGGGSGGSIGATGAQGPVGPMGPTGPQGPVGPQGAAGAQGLQGAVGPTGPQGATGAQGPAGTAPDTSTFAQLNVPNAGDLLASVGGGTRSVGLVGLAPGGTATLSLGDGANQITNTFNQNLQFSAFNGFVFNGADQFATQTANVFEVQQSGTPLFTIADGGRIFAPGSIAAATFYGDGSHLTGIAGTPGPEGPQGPAGDPGPAGPPGTFDGVRIQVNAVQPNAPNVIAGDTAADQHNLIGPTVWGSSILGGGNDSSPNVIIADPNQPAGTPLQFATIGGGMLNTVRQSYGAIGGGSANIVSGAYGGFGSVIAGGRNNNISDNGPSLFATDSFIGGGNGNHVYANNGAIGGGGNNGVQGRYSFVGGGQLNNAGTATQGWAVVGGGSNNNASGDGSVIPGGVSNTAAGTNSFAAGTLAQATHDHSFVWSDGTSATQTTAPNQFVVRASGGVAIIGSVTATTFIGDGSGLSGVGGATGPMGPQGATGPTGGIGPAGPTGPQGIAGPAGPAGAASPQAIKAALMQWYPIASAYPVPGAHALAFDGFNVVIAAEDNSVSRRRVSDGSLVGVPTSVGPYPTSLAFDGTHIWVGTSDNVVTQINDSDGSILHNTPLDSTPAALLFDGSNIWALCANSLNKLRVADGALLASFPLTGHTVNALAGAMTFDGQHLWVCCSGSEVLEIRPSDGQVLTTVDVSAEAGPTGSRGLAFDGANVWVAAGGSAVLKIRASDGTPLGTVPVDPGAASVAFDGANVWTANVTAGTVSKIRVADGALVATYSIPRAWKLVFDGTSVWVVDDTSTLTKMP